MSEKIIRVIARAADGSLRTREYECFSAIEQLHEQVGLDDCSTDLDLRGMPVFRGLVGPMSDGKDAVRYESPEVFEVLTKEWTQKKSKRRRRRSAKEMAEAAAREAVQSGQAEPLDSPAAQRPHFPMVTTSPAVPTASPINNI